MKKSRVKEIKQIAEQINNNQQKAELEKILSDNKAVWEKDNAKYRVHYPTHEDVIAIEDAVAREYSRLVQDPAFLFRADWIVNYRKKNIDIEAMEEEYNEKTEELNQLSIKMTEETDEAEKKKIFHEYLLLLDEQEQLFYKKHDLLKFSIEDKVNFYSKMFGVYVTLDVEKDGKFERLFKTFEDFMKADTNENLKDIMITANKYYQLMCPNRGI